MNEAIIFDYVRTPCGLGLRSGALHAVPPVELARQVLAALRERNGQAGPDVDDVILGIARPIAEQAGNLARAAALGAGFRSPAAQIERGNASGLDAVSWAAAKVSGGQAQLAIGGGVESMSRVSSAAAGGALFADPRVVFSTRYLPEGIAADLMATRAGLSRSDLEGYVLEDRRRADQAAAQGRGRKSMIAVADALGRTLLDHDEALDAAVSAEALARLELAFAASGKNSGHDALAMLQFPDAFAIQHVHSAATCAPEADGAAAIMVGNSDIGNRFGLKPRARIRASVSGGGDQADTGGSIVRRVLEQAGMSISDIELFEINEAFAAQGLVLQRELGFSMKKLNAGGGALSLGNPAGAGGAMALCRALDGLEYHGKGMALVLAYAGLGMCTATLIERL